MTDTEIMDAIAAWFPLEDHSVRENKFVYVSSEAITRRMNNIFGVRWGTDCESYAVIPNDDGKWAAHAHVRMHAYTESDTMLSRSGLGACVGRDLDMVVKTALVEAKKKAFYEFGGCGYLWDEANTDRIKLALSKNAASIQNYLVNRAVEAGTEAKPEAIAKFYGVEKIDMIALPSLTRILMEQR